MLKYRKSLKHIGSFVKTHKINRTLAELTKKKRNQITEVRNQRVMLQPTL